MDHSPVGSRLVSRLTALLGPAAVSNDPDVVAGAEVDWTGRFRGRCLARVAPASAAEVAAVLTACGEAGVPVVPQGGRTGLVGGAVPRSGQDAGEVVLSTRRLTEVGPVDPVAAQVTVGAGVPLAVLQRTARAAGLDVGLDLAARDSATVGGLVATDAGGGRVLRYGTARASVAGVEAVLASGTVVRRLSGLPKEGVGPDLAGLLAGSEGTLAVLSAVRWRLVPLRPARVVALVGLPSVDAALALLGRLRALPALEAVEVFGAAGLDLVRAVDGLPAPLPRRWPVYVLAECAGADGTADDLAADLAEALAARDPGTDADTDDAVAAATDAAGRAALWRYREGHTEALQAAPGAPPVKLDVAVPLPALAEAWTALPAAASAAAPGARTVVFGHLAEGNLHVNVLGAGDRVTAVEEAVLTRVAMLGGSIAAEHGVGQAKVAYVGLSRSPEEIALLRAVKAALDPAGLLNPGKLLPPA